MGVSVFSPNVALTNCTVSMETKSALPSYSKLTYCISVNFAVDKMPQFSSRKGPETWSYKVLRTSYWRWPQLILILVKLLDLKLTWLLHFLRSSNHGWWMNSAVNFWNLNCSIFSVIFVIIACLALALVLVKRDNFKQYMYCWDDPS